MDFKNKLRVNLVLFLTALIVSSFLIVIKLKSSMDHSGKLTSLKVMILLT